METSAEVRHNGTVIRFDTSIIPTMEPRLFEPDWLRANGHFQGSAKGRGQAHFLRFAGRDMVLRKFMRGGFVGKFNRDLFLRIGKNQSRAMQEFDLLDWMYTNGLPVPRPVAARYAISGLFYRADIVTERIPDAHTLADALRDAALPVPLWIAIGATIRQLHDHNVFHSDLNCRNILIDAQEKVWLIDFDKCERRKTGDWTTQNLDRLQRSLRKENVNFPKFHWTDQDWASLMSGYAGKAGVNSDGTKS